MKQNLTPELIEFATKFDAYLLSLGFKPIGEDGRGFLMWREEDALPIMAALERGSKAVPSGSDEPQ